MAKRVIQSKRRMMARRVCGSAQHSAHCLSLPLSSIRSALIFFISLVCMKGTHTHSRGYVLHTQYFAKAKYISNRLAFTICVCVFDITYGCNGHAEAYINIPSLLHATFLLPLTCSSALIPFLVNISLSPIQYIETETIAKPKEN